MIVQYLLKSVLKKKKNVEPPHISFGKGVGYHQISKCFYFVGTTQKEPKKIQISKCNVILAACCMHNANKMEYLFFQLFILFEFFYVGSYGNKT